ncbi:zinc finger MYM-type protein 5-like [Impatiens glandulifera]|uniref:zinc finger MYM-type protein 5-like n=1 Tax=Impatiens glandulifera TaxID=253017 RepID=UPI001FB11A69|nr:zinc finger MYM-type protein 5-like [Impatiens glandulifera]
MAWSLKKILKLKDIATSLFDIILGDGQGTLFRHDPWFENQPIIRKAKFGEQVNQNDIDDKLNDREHGELNELRNEDPKQSENENDVSMPKSDTDGDINQKILFPLNVDDLGNWDKMQNIKDFLVEIGPKTGRHFNPSHYKRQLTNGEKSDRRLLVYSISMDKIFCFCCKLFKTQRTMAKLGYLADEGYKDWKNIS